jgi:hypothetical protein
MSNAANFTHTGYRIACGELDEEGNITWAVLDQEGTIIETFTIGDDSDNDSQFFRAISDVFARLAAAPE